MHVFQLVKETCQEAFYNFFKGLHTANLYEMQDILVSGFSGWLRAKMAD
jgi:hypothetical protein